MTILGTKERVSAPATGKGVADWRARMRHPVVFYLVWLILLAIVPAFIFAAIVLNRANEAQELRKILDAAWEQDLRYFTNQDTDIHPRTEQWSNGVNQAEELDRLMKVRRSALNRMGEQTIRLGAPMTTIEESLVPIWMYHRYAVEGTASMIGGQDIIYAMRGDGRTPVKWESAVSHTI